MFLLLLRFTEIPVCNANNVDPDLTPRSVVSDLGLHYLPITHFGFSSLKLVQVIHGP